MTTLRKVPHSMEGELDLLRMIRRRAPRAGRGSLALGIGDDCALLRIRPDEEIAVTTDLSLDGRHFRLEWHSPEAIGHRTLARGLSDLAAMGARPLGAFISLGLPPELAHARRGRKSWVERFYDGLFQLASRHGTPLAGGDLSESSVALADVVLVGAVPKGRALLRSGARPGDLLYVTGSLGGASAGLQALARLGSGRGVRRQVRIPADLQEVLWPHLYPEPRLVQSEWLQRRGVVTAAIDISDGLSTDLMHLCEESHVSAEIEAASLPLSPGVTLDQALHGGEDYELLFAARPAARLPRRIAGVPITRIGHIARRRPRAALIRLRTESGAAPLAPQGWEHFSGAKSNS